MESNITKKVLNAVIDEICETYQNDNNNYPLLDVIEDAKYTYKYLINELPKK